MNNMVTKLLQRTIRLIYPECCPFCDEVTGGEGKICNKCLPKIKYVGNPSCMKCGKPISQDEKEYCYDCSVKQHIFDRGISIFIYSDLVRKSIFRFKYENRKCYAKTYAKLLKKDVIHTLSEWGCDAIIPVPISRERYKKRGYNQAELLAREISEIINLPVDSSTLCRVKNTKPQKNLEANERAKNLENAFKISKNVVQYKKIILVDDIFTTGNTFDACADVLKKAGVNKIYFISLSIGTGI